MLNIHDAMVVVCTPPEAPQNGSFSPSNQTRWIENDVVTFSCDSRFRLVGNTSSVTCTETSSFVDKVFCMGKQRALQYFTAFANYLSCLKNKTGNSVLIACPIFMKTVSRCSFERHFLKIIFVWL